jgi:putative endonuclease
MYWVYALYSRDFDKIYIGSTSDLTGRLNAHNHPANHGWTARFKPWTLLYSEAYTSKSEALHRERELKTARGRVFIRNLIP